jgi:hypothetical protein
MKMQFRVAVIAIALTLAFATAQVHAQTNARTNTNLYRQNLAKPAAQPLPVYRAPANINAINPYL